MDRVNVSEVLDVQNTVATSFLSSVASKSYTIHPTDCTGSTSINADSWTPSF